MLQALRDWWERPRQKSARPPLAGRGNTRLGDLLALRDAWQTTEGFRQPDWTKIRAWIEGRSTDETERAAMWHDASLQWLDTLRQDLGGKYDVAEGRLCLLLSARPSFSARHLVGQCDAIVRHLQARLGRAAWRWPHGKHAVLMFNEEEYYRYLSHFHAEESVHSTSSGVFLRYGYAHTALPYGHGNLSVLAHELVHLCLSHHRSLPVWLNEGLAMCLERETFDPRGRGFDREAARKQRIFWTAESIQRFWSGDAFLLDEEQKMSYNLAELLVGLLLREFKSLEAFIASARRRDAGESAAREHLDLGLDEIAAAVLGEGDWQPKPPPAQERSQPAS